MYGFDTWRRRLYYNGFDMIEGKCPKCGTLRYGWALLNPRYQTCPVCGSGLDIYKDGVLLSKGFSPFTAPRIDVNQPTDAPSPHQKQKDKDKQ
jgi:hypothetical protein